MTIKSLKTLEQVEPAAIPMPGNSPTQMMQVALQAGMDPATIRELMALQKEWEANEARKAYVSAMAAFKADPPEIFKDKHVKFQTARGVTEYDHATIGNVTSAVCVGLGRHCFSHGWDVKQDGGKITVVCKITHAMGHSESVQMTAAADDSGGKNSIQQIASTVTYLQRYTLLAGTGLATKDMDDDGRAAEIELITEEQAATLQDLLTTTESDKAKFLRYLKVDSLASIPAQAYQTALSALKQKEKAKLHESA